MDIVWKNVESTVQPLELDKLSSSNGIYIRKNITKEIRTISNIPTDFWLYEEAFLTQSEYGQYIDTICTTPEYTEEQECKKQEHKAKTSLPRTDFFKAVYLSKQVTPEMIRNAILSITDETTKNIGLIEFDFAKDFYRGNPLFNVLAPIFKITEQELDELFGIQL